ncbi:MAG: 3-isopropylmalate dehydratase small subunit [Burkholderiales bacterium]|nr:3-isopropylmalate dehydratase small subunit [Burkholderiales bacterium]
MEKFIRHRGLVAPQDRANVDTDAIIPKQFLTSIHRTGFGQNLFDEWRYLDRGTPGQDCSKRPLNQQFTLNLPRHAGASILLARRNFGCGSSREHAAWALCEYGFRIIIAPDFGDIFYQNSLKNGLLCVALSETEIDQLFTATAGVEPLMLDVDLPAQTVHGDDPALRFRFDIDPFRKHCLCNGLDDVALTLAKADRIREFERGHWSRFPWLAEPL